MTCEQAELVSNTTLSKDRPSGILYVHINENIIASSQKRHTFTRLTFHIAYGLGFHECSPKHHYIHVLIVSVIIHNAVIRPVRL